MNKETKQILKYIALFLFMFMIGFTVGKSVNRKTEPKAEPKEIVKYVEVIAEREPTEKEPEFISLGMYETTAYCSCVKCCGKSDGITASGTQATQGRTIAADTSIFPFGTELYINGNKNIVEDTGKAIKGKRLDIYFNNHTEALQYGRKTVEVFAIK